MNIKFIKPIAYFALICSTLTAQTGKTGKTAKQVHPQLAQENTETMNVVNRGCASVVPDAQWENQFQQLIAQQKLDEANNKTMANYTIPVVIHIIHGGQALGTYPNISNAQAVSQITVLNNDFAAAGLNVGNYPATAFTAYATAAALPAANKDGNGRPKISNFNISFCLAVTDKNGNPMSEPGVDRVNYTTIATPTSATYPSKNPAATNYNSITTFQSFIDGYIKPATIWDPTKYMNIWVTDEQAAVGLLGFGTFPAASGLTGIPGGTGTATTDGLWCWTKSFGNTGTLQAPYNKGRTATHEIGHWLGLRHIWGDATCATDYCLDTPPAAAANSGTPAYPFHANTCTSPTGVSNTTANGANGEMFMNFMDYTDDTGMYMFTEDQRTRAQAAMANGTYRKFLGTHGLCSASSPTPAVALYTMTNTACNGSPVSVTNNSTGSPSPTYTWSASPATGVIFSPNANATAPSITFTNNGSYVITLAAQSGTTAVSTKTNAITISTCTTPAVCNLTVTNVSSTDTMYVSSAGTDTATPGCSPKAGYVFGSNCYDDKEKASFFAASKYSSVTGPFVTGAVVVFYKSGNTGTVGTASRAVNLKMYNGTLAAGPTGTVGVATSTSNIGLIGATTATNSIGYLGGDVTVTYGTNIAIPYKYTFTTPIAAPAGGFFLSVTTPTTTGDTAVVLNDFHATANSSWEMWSDNSWNDMNVAWGGLLNNMAIFPIITCSTKLTEYNSLTNNINIMPNPSNGIFNIMMTLPTTQDITIDVTNMLGQNVYSNHYKSLMNGIVPVDLSDKNQGVYFVTVSNGLEKNVQRVIITK